VNGTGDAGDRKRSVRASLLAARRAVAPEQRRLWSGRIARQVAGLPAFRSARTLAAYVSLGGEVDPSPLVAAAVARGARVVYPRTLPGQRRLGFAACAPEALAPGAFGAHEPPACEPDVAPGDIDVVLLPGVAFTPGGLRLGRGGGHFDATLAAMPRAFRVGLAFDLQIVDALPREAHDVVLDAIVTEARVFLVDRDSI
jgi:5-formyltetrahydrofolate cyclo-ligase